MKNHIIQNFTGYYYNNGAFDTLNRDEAQRMSRSVSFAVARGMKDVRIYRVETYAPSVHTDAGLSATGIKDTNNCTIRALSLAANIPYELADKIGIEAGRVRGKGMYTRDLMNQSLHHGIRFNYSALKLHKASITIGKFIERNPKGRFVCRMSKHAFAVIDGVVHDSGSLKAGCRITDVWEITTYGVQS